MKKKRILIIVFIFFILIIGIIYKIKLTNTNEENNIEIVGKETLKVVNEVENVVSNQNVVEEKKEITEENIVSEKEIVKEQPKAEQQVKKTIVKEETKKNVPVQETVVTHTQEVVIEKIEEQSVPTPPPTPTPSPTTQEPPKQVAPTPEPTPPVATVPTEEYKYNDSMTQTIINIINSNPSEYMKLDGFSVVVDSSITGLTNQFTFSEERVKNYIAYKAGTIRVYAQDYYNNGVLLFTECYIF